jgi:hypothetical protein
MHYARNTFSKVNFKPFFLSCKKLKWKKTFICKWENFLPFEMVNSIKTNLWTYQPTGPLISYKSFNQFRNQSNGKTFSCLQSFPKKTHKVHIRPTDFKNILNEKGFF